MFRLTSLKRLTPCVTVPPNLASASELLAVIFAKSPTSNPASAAALRMSVMPSANNAPDAVITLNAALVLASSVCRISKPSASSFAAAVAA